ncbi:hypothetical protein [Paenibacillus sp. FSL L8-0709]|uniref:hypothetical protein n=1 Tax=Paenibacillus sp. FSL L8-0709 TaxID=2975312 RepID=UPI0030F6DDB2
MFQHIVTTMHIDYSSNVQQALEPLFESAELLKSEDSRFTELELFDESFNLNIVRIQDIFEWQKSGKQDLVEQLYRLLLIGRSMKEYIVILLDSFDQIRQIENNSLRIAVENNCFHINKHGHYYERGGVIVTFEDGKINILKTFN